MKRSILIIASALALVLFSSIFAITYSSSSPNHMSNGKPLIERTSTVLYVVDGDTICLEDEEKVRLSGINTPELRSSDPDNKRLANEAKEFVEGICTEGTEVGLDVDDLTPKDRYGRTLAIVYVKIDDVWTNLNYELLRSGFADILYIPPSEFNPYRWLSQLSRQD